MTALTDTRYLTTTTAAAYLGRTEAAIRGLVRRGEIPCVRIGRRVQFDKERLDRWMGRDR